MIALLAAMAVVWFGHSVVSVSSSLSLSVCLSVCLSVLPML